MSFGLRIFDDEGYVVLDENSYTVRMVTGMMVNGGILSQNQTVTFSAPAVTPDMFAIVMPLRQYSKVYKHYSNYKWYRYLNSTRYTLENHDVLLSMPSVQVHNGYISVKGSPIAYSRTDSNVAVYVFTNS